VKALVLWLAMTAGAVLLGFCLAWVVLLAFNAALPFRFPEDDDSLREYAPVAIAYATWLLTTVFGAAVTWRWVRGRPESD
jgi:hypothetical protein